eukprot:jgi/Galph1/2920/GphlegSOOS_G1584.1
MPYDECIKQFELDIHSIEKIFKLDVPQMIAEMNVSIKKFLKAFGTSLEDFVQQTGTTIQDVLKWFSISFEDFVKQLGLDLSHIVKIFDPIQHSKVGDVVLDAQGKPTHVIVWLHKDQTQEVDFLHIQFNDMANNLTMSGDHLVFSSVGVIPSKQITLSNVWLENEAGSLTSQSVKWLRSKEVYTPLTESGTLLVDGVACSCYAYISNHWVANFFIPTLWKMLRAFHSHKDLISLAPATIEKVVKYF